ncbi:hypothetical protein Ciccas_012514 [Cichlidogyrus casuarinus]|uniref:Uncharacterized protein n=1 Tax=Cichlidogyrus casuarinus TaxID=1844966 RepID=A0ABD2PQ00_9PLAT
MMRMLTRGLLRGDENCQMGESMCIECEQPDHLTPLSHEGTIYCVDWTKTMERYDPIDDTTMLLKFALICKVKQL